MGVTPSFSLTVLLKAGSLESQSIALSKNLLEERRFEALLIRFRASIAHAH